MAETTKARQQSAERLGWQFHGDIGSFQTGDGWNFYSDSPQRLVQIGVNEFRKEPGHIIARRYVDGECIEKSNATLDRLLADIEEWDAHPSRSEGR
jgi:hypothetical protein